MALFDPRMFDPESYQGMLGGLLGSLNFPQPTPSAGFPGVPQDAQLPPNVQPTMAQPQQQQPYPSGEQAMGVAPQSGGPQGGLGNLLSGLFPQAAPQMPQAMAQAQPQMQQPQPGQQPMQPQQGQSQSPLYAQEAAPSLFDRLSAASHNFGASGGLIPGLFDAAQGMSTGQRMDPQGMAMAQLNATYQALRAKGVPDADARAAALNPDILKTVAGNYFDTKPQFGVIGQNQMGVNQYGFIRPNQESVTPANAGGTTVGTSGGIDPSLSGDDYLKAVAADPTLGPGKAQMIKAIAEGRAPYPSGFLLKTPFGQWLTTAIGQYEPGLDATLIGQRSTFNKQMGSATPSSVGGQKTLMGTSLGHLSEVADAAADLGNNNGMGFAPLAHVTNAMRGISTDQAAKVNKLNETVDRFSGEVGKLYSGSAGGGVQEREQTRSRFGGSQSAAELASGLEASRDLIKSKLAALENQQDQIFGPNAKGRVDFLGDNGRAALGKIDTAITKLRGQDSQASAPGAASPPPSAVAALKSTPALRDQFEAKYGAGSAAKVLGQ